MQDDVRWMELALEQARLARDEGEVPVGAVLVRGDEVIGRGRNRREAAKDPLAHAEIEAIRQAVVEGNDDSWRLDRCCMYVTLEPCAMCAGALVAARVERLVYAAEDPKGGWCGSLGDLVRDPRQNHRLEVVAGVCRDEAGALLRRFFAALRAGD